MAVENIEEVGKVLMDLATAVSVSKGQHGVVVGILFERLAGGTLALCRELAQMLCPLKQLSG